MSISHLTLPVAFSPGLVYLNLTIIFQMFNFLLLLWLLTRFLYRPIVGALDRRSEQIKASLDEAARNREDSREELERIRREYDDAKRDSYDIRQQARSIAEEEKERIIESGKATYDEMMTKARKDTDLELERAKDELRRRVGEIGADIACKILREDLSEEQRRRATSEYLDAAQRL